MGQMTVSSSSCSRFLRKASSSDCTTGGLLTPDIKVPSEKKMKVSFKNASQYRNILYFRAANFLEKNKNTNMSGRKHHVKTQK